MTTDSAQPVPHDLLWGMGPHLLPAQAPDWARQVLAQGQPVVVRRQRLASGWLAVGIRGARREQRYATELHQHQVRACITPEQAARQPAHGSWPALLALAALRPRLDSQPLSWGVTGSVGFALATGIAVLHSASDLDLLLRTPTAMSRSVARDWLKLFDAVDCRVDVQLETPHGAVALREWAGAASRVLLKSATGAALVEDPWQALEPLV
ncbi:phosphoribosyl-dephospho-CoA transferase [Pseudomonas sp. TE3786]